MSAKGKAVIEWSFSDGTIVRLGGIVEGDGLFAQKLRSELELLEHDRARPVVVRPQPGGDETLDPSDAYHVDCWVRDLMRFVSGVSIVSAPTMPSRELETSDTDAVY